MPLRLFDAVAYQQDHFAKEDMLSYKKDKAWKHWSTGDVQKQVNNLSAGLLSLGVSANDFTVEHADKIAIVSNSRPEWITADIAVQQIGAIFVPLYPTTNPDEVEFILKEAEVKYVFVSSQLLLNKYEKTIRNCPTVKNIFTFEETSADNWNNIFDLATPELLQQVEAIKQKIPDEYIATIIYTSGTTGIPKGVMLSHKNIISNIMLAKQSFPLPDDPSLRALSFLPLNHIYEKCIVYVYMFSGVSIYFAEGIETIGENLREVKPHIFTTVPRLLEKVFEKIMHAGYQLKGAKKKIFVWSVNLGKRFGKENNNAAYHAKLSLANKLVFNKWRAALGGNLKYVITGGAACPENILRIFNAAKIPVYEGYGPTENSPIIAVNRATKNGSRIGTVGPVMDGIELKLEDDGEICVKGPTVMKGYYKNPQLTNETIIGGWLHTGDIGTLAEGKFLKITDRKKELFKTSSGKYVAPQPVENKLKENAIIEQAMILGAEEKYVSALIVPSETNLKAWMERRNLVFKSLEDAIHLSEVKKHFSDIIKKVNAHFSPHEQIKKHALLTREWSVESGELTPKLSIKRKVISEKYKDVIEGMYK